MRKPLIATILSATVVFSAQSVMADVESNLEADIEVDNRGNIEAEATNYGGIDNKISSNAQVVDITMDARDGTRITSDMNVDVDVRNRGDIEATVTNYGGINNEVSATAGVVSITVESSQ